MNSREIVKKHRKAPARAFKASKMNNNDEGMKQHEFQQSVLTMQKSLTIRSSSQDSYLNFEEKRQLIASSLSLSDILSNQVGPAVAQAAKDVAAASSVIGKFLRFKIKFEPRSKAVIDQVNTRNHASHLLPLKPQKFLFVSRSSALNFSTNFIL